MPIGAAMFFAAALVLGGSGVAKLARPQAVAGALAAARLPGWGRLGRLPVGTLSGVVEIAVAAGAIAYGNRLAGVLVVAAFATFAAVAIRLLRAAGTAPPCGCFGDADTPVGGLHVVLDLAGAGAGAAAIVSPPGSVLDALRGQPWGGAGIVALSVAVALVAYLGFTVVPRWLHSD